MNTSTLQTDSGGSGQSVTKDIVHKKIAILVPNPCNPDYRIIKYAELFKKNGHDVRVYCGRSGALPEQESINGIVYIRKYIAPKSIISLASTHPQNSTKQHSKKVVHPPETPNEGAQNKIPNHPIKFSNKAKNKFNHILKIAIKSAKKLANQINRRIAYKYQPTAYRVAFEHELEKWQPDIVHCHDWQTLEFGAKIKKKTNCVLIFDSHELETHRNPPLPPARQRWMAKYEGRLLPQCDFVTTVCSSIAEHLHIEYKITKPMVIVNAPIVDRQLSPVAVARWGRIPVDSDVRSESKFPSSSYLLVVVGNLTINRGIETLLQAMQLLPENVVLAMIGKSTDEFRQKIESLIIECKLSSRVKMIEPVNPVHLVDFLKTADAGIIPIIPKTLSYEYALPNKLFECAFAGLPVIASDTKELKLITEKFRLGVTFPPGDVQALANAITEKMKSNNKMNQQVICQKFINEMNFETSALQLLQIINHSTQHSKSLHR